MAKKKRQGHYCRICGEHKANEKFSGKGHAKHICKVCDALPQERKNELQHINRIAGAAMKFPRTKANWEFLEKMAKSRKYPEAAEFAASFLNRGNSSTDSDDWEDEDADVYEDAELLSFVDDEDTKEELRDYLDDLIADFFIKSDYLPTQKHKEKILDTFNCEVFREYGCKVFSVEELDTLYNESVKNTLSAFEEDGIIRPTYMESLTVMETERLTIRKFISDDLYSLQSIMEKPEVMYAWEHGFTRSETRKWLNRQLTRYKKDGYGYFAVILKGTDLLIGQAGLMKNEINGTEAIELGYIFDNGYWHQGFAIEAAKACIELAFEKLKLDKLYCSIRPNNKASISICEKLGMEKAGEHSIIYREQEMKHIIYTLSK